MRDATVIVPFFDLQEDVLRNVGDAFQVSDERAETLEKSGFVTLSPAEKKPARKKTTK